jgi:hypothetical protein
MKLIKNTKGAAPAMQPFVRTVNTTDAFRIKLEHLEREYKIKLQSIKEEIAQQETERNRLEMAGVGGQWRGGFLRLIGWLGTLIGVLAAVLGGAVLVSESPGERAYAILIFTFALILLVLGVIFIAKGSAIQKEESRKQEEALIRQNAVETELERLREELRGMEQYYQDEMIKQKLLYERHMLNQQELIEQEVAAIKQTEPFADAAAEWKECPQCAETVKLKAKICRFCGYSFAE